MAATEHTPDEGAQRIAEGTARYGGQWIDRFGARALHVVRAVCAGEAQPADALHVRVYCSADRAFADRPVADVVARLAAAGGAGFAAHHRPTRLHQIRVGEGEYLAWPVYQLLRAAWQAERTRPAAAPAAACPT